MDLAPIVIFAFNRVETLKRAVLSLLENEEAKDSELFVFVDGPRTVNVSDVDKVRVVQEYVRSIVGFKKIIYTFSEKNKGLAQSIIGGVTEVIDLYGKVIVVEDDLYLSKSFLRFMNEMLNKYQEDERIMQVSGFGCKLSKIGEYPYDAYLNERAHSWTWGTWKDRWETIDWEVKDFNELSGSIKKRMAFNKRGSDLYKMLKGYITGMNNSWYIRFNFSMYKQRRYSLMPIRSLVRNDGFGEEATNCSNYNRYKVDFEGEHYGEFYVPNNIEPCERIIVDSVRYWTLRYRIYGKAMTFLTKLFR